MWRIVMTAVVTIFLAGCSAKIAKTGDLPEAKRIAIYAFANYTDTPEAGRRAANIVAGVLRARGYEVVSYIEEERPKDLAKATLGHGLRYYVDGGVSEWRYKTGIDGEPAVSLRVGIVDARTKREVWSSVASDSSWGNTALGVIAQELIEDMF